MDKAAKKTVLDNGIKILTKQMPSVHSISMGIWVDVGTRDENPSENGLSHFIEHMLFKGTNTRSAFQIAKDFDAIGGHANAFTTMENTCYHAKVVAIHLPLLVNVLSDIFLNSNFESKEIKNERPVILQEIAMIEDNPEDNIHTLISKVYWGDHPLGQSILGTPKNIKEFNSELIKDFFQKFYTPNNIIIAAAGNIEHESFVKLIAPIFDRIKNTSKKLDRKPPDACSKILIKNKDLEQLHICFGFEGIPITDPKRYSFSLLNTILGGNMSSRLFQELREKKGLAYSVYSFLSSNTDSGMFGIYAGVDPKKAKQTIEIILTELSTLKKGIIDISEIDNAKECTKANILLSSDSTDCQMFRIAQNELNFGRHIQLEDVLNNIDSVTKDEICELAEHVFKKELFALTMIGKIPDRKNIEQFIKYSR
ncbi:MAG: insulinase family protein [Desulfobacterales bacterium]|nr:insulinase family protein [Desulfobacterales bacterium]MBF0395832.1 insulinase family protein [Desulfobacterales bacterium]